MAMKNDREYRCCTPFEVRQAEPEEEKSYIVEGYATTFDDSYLLWDDGETQVFEKIDKKAFDNADMSDVLFLYNHEGRVYARQKNGSLELSVDDHGLHIKANLGLTEEARKMYEDIQAGLIDQMSWAFTVNADEYNRETHTRTITGVKKVYDVSAVSIPANPNTDIAARDYFNGVIEEERRRDREREEILVRMRIKLKLGGNNGNQ